MRPGENLTVVLHQTRSPDNLGSVARLMANFGLSRLILSDPATFAFHEAEKLAVKGGDVLDGLTVRPGLQEALSDVVYACGTTSRYPLKGRTVITPEEAAGRLAQHAARGQVALVFGGEKRGLSDEELALVQDVLVIPTDTVQPSMNLAQSAAVLLYLCGRALQAVVPPQEAAPQAPEPGAALGTLHALGKRMQGLLLEADFLNPQAPEHVLRELERSLMRAQLTQREAELWLTAFKQLERWGRQKR